MVDEVTHAPSAPCGFCSSSARVLCDQCLSLTLRRACIYLSGRGKLGSVALPGMPRAISFHTQKQFPHLDANSVSSFTETDPSLFSHLVFGESSRHRGLEREKYLASSTTLPASAEPLRGCLQAGGRRNANKKHVRFSLPSHKAFKEEDTFSNEVGDSDVSEFPLSRSPLQRQMAFRVRDPSPNLRFFRIEDNCRSLVDFADKNCIELKCMEILGSKGGTPLAGNASVKLQDEGKRSGGWYKGDLRNNSNVSQNLGISSNNMVHEVANKEGRDSGWESRRRNVADADAGIKPTGADTLPSERSCDFETMVVRPPKWNGFNGAVKCSRLALSTTTEACGGMKGNLLARKCENSVMTRDTQCLYRSSIHSAELVHARKFLASRDIILERRNGSPEARCNARDFVLETTKTQLCEAPAGEQGSTTLGPTHWGFLNVVHTQSSLLWQIVSAAFKSNSGTGTDFEVSPNTSLEEAPLWKRRGFRPPTTLHVGL